MKIQRMSDLEAEMRKVAKGEITAPADAALPSTEETRTGAKLVDAIQASPFCDLGIEPSRAVMPVRDVSEL
jgi:hypothetical protein